MASSTLQYCSENPATELSAFEPSFSETSCREWLTVNGTGSYAMGTMSGANTRRYHGYLVADLPAPYGRMVLLGKVEETLVLGGETFGLSSNAYPDGTVHPNGWQYLAGLTSFPCPTWRYQFASGARLEKRLFFARGKNTIYVRYLFTGPSAIATLRLAPLVAWKSYHAEMHPFSGFPSRSEASEYGWLVQATPDAPVLRLLNPDGVWTNAGWWNRNLLHARERERGFDHTEDLYCPALCEISLRSGESVTIVATLETDTPDNPQAVFETLAKYCQNLTAIVPSDQPARRALMLAADQFLVRRPALPVRDTLAGTFPSSEGRPTLLAGYPWFTDWGRDTMISLPGICLTTGRYPEARSILMEYARFVSEGMIPNRFPDTGETPDYNTVDATLWFVNACWRYVQATQDRDFVRVILPTLSGIIDSHRVGTRYGIGEDPDDGLLRAGQTGTQLTWMDAKVGDRAITPRIGKPVEINALWVNALRIVGEWKGPRWGTPYVEAAQRSAGAFCAAFVRPDGLGLYDVIAPDGRPDPAIRPNQVLAAALPFSPVTDEIARTILAVAERELLTPYGLRTLAPSDPRYRGRYEGGPEQRDSAYHQGTVWPWLLGAFVDLYRRVHGPLVDVSTFTTPLLTHLAIHGLGGVAEVYDGDAPQRPNGCPWQAWSTAELLRVLT